MSSSSPISLAEAPAHSTHGPFGLGDREGQECMKATPSRSQLPSVQEVLLELAVSAPVATNTDTVIPETETERTEEAMFRSLNAILKRAMDEDSKTETFDLSELKTSLEQADIDAQKGTRDIKALEDVRAMLRKLWRSRSPFLAQFTEALANGCRDPSWRAPYGQAGILQFFLDLISSKDHVENSVLLHALRLVGNSCADTDLNRELIVKGNYTLAILRHFLNPDLIHVAIPVIYNICMDYEPAQSQVAANRAAYILLKLIQEGAVHGHALLNFSYELIEMASEQEDGIARSPDGTVLLLMELAVNEGTDLAQYACLVNCLTAYLAHQRFRDVCVSTGTVEGLLAVLKRSSSIQVDTASSEEAKLLEQLRLKTNQALAEVSASSLFTERYPLDSALSKTLSSWLIAEESQLTICACVLLGNMARSDEVCQRMVREKQIHKQLIQILTGSARGAVLHAALGFLKNLAIAGDNRTELGREGVIPAISRLWTLETVPQVQLSAVSLARLVIISSVENNARLLEPLSLDPDSPANSRTYLSLLLSLFEKTDSAPIRTEVGRTVASICRTVVGGAGRAAQTDSNSETAVLFERFFRLHSGLARPIGEMVTQSQWPVVRSEGIFALALMASCRPGILAVVDCLQNDEVYQRLQDAITAKITESTEDAHRTRIPKDRENALVLLQKLWEDESDALPPSWRSMIEELLRSHVSEHVKSDRA